MKDLMMKVHMYEHQYEIMCKSTGKNNIAIPYAMDEL